MLVVALIVITTIATVTGALLGHGWANLRSTVALRGVAGTSYAADAAAKVAINDLRLGSTAPDWTTPGFDGNWNDGSWNAWVYTNNSDGTGCFGAQNLAAQNNLELDGISPKLADQTDVTSARVECSPVAGTGILSGGKGVTIADPNSTDPYAHALTTLGSSPTSCSASTNSGCSGAYLKVLGAGNHNTVPVGGGVLSNTSVSVDNGSLTTDGFVHANGTCTGTIVSSDTECQPGAATMPTPVADLLTALPTPIYDAASTYPAHNAAGACYFTPGTYASGTALSTAVNACTVAYFASGQYYFDFQDSNASKRVWNIGATEVIGGEPTGSLSIPGACKSPIGADNGGKGVQFVFGGSSGLSFGHNSQVELCGPSNGGKAPLTIMQQQTSGPSVTITDAPTPTPTTTTTSFGPEPANTVTTLRAANNSRDAFVPNNSTGSNNNLPVPSTNLALAGDSTGATWTATTIGNTGELDLSNFTDSIPSGATITSATLHVALSGTRSTDVTPSVSVNGTSVGSISTATSDMDAKSALQSAVPTSGTLAPSVRFTIPAVATGSAKSPAAGSTVTIDQVTLAVTYTTTSTTTPPPTTTTVALEPATSTTLISSTGGTPSQPATFVVQGSTYVPQGDISIEDSQSDLIAFRWGIVAQGVDFKTYPQQLFGYPLVSIPAPGQSLGSTVTAVDLKVFVCVSSPTCATGSGTQTLAVRVLITDPPYTNHPTVAKRQIKILSWSEQR